ncbi:MAG TPA: hypothetical protein VFF68_01145 [Anaerolineaceae bacterium]|nr:hypothetical protein [Anaerolineaceae bacterium]
MWPENRLETILERQGAPRVELRDAGAALEHFAAWVDTLGPPEYAGPALRARVLLELKTVAEQLDASGLEGQPGGYDRRVLFEIPGRWTLAVIILRPGQQTEAHDHGGWGCAVTVQGIERDQRLTHGVGGRLEVLSERDYPAGAGYSFDALAIHQPLGADPQRVTVGLHFLVHADED